MAGLKVLPSLYTSADYCASNCHVELFLTEKDENVPKAEKKPGEKSVPHLSKKQVARLRLRVGKAPAKPVIRKRQKAGAKPQPAQQ